MTVYLKAYNSKLCRKGLLERGLSVGKFMSEFKELETEFLRKAAQRNSNVQELVKEIKKEKSVSILNELKILKRGMEGLTKTMENVKKEVKSMTDGASLQKWAKHTDDIAKKFKIFYSAEANNLYDHFYKMDGKFEQLISEIERDTKLIKRNVSTPFSKKKRESLLMEDSWVEDESWIEDDSWIDGEKVIKKKKSNDSGFISNDSGLIDPGPNEGNNDKIKTYAIVDTVGEVYVSEFDEMLQKII